jgi:hypothetical protein
MTTLAASYKVNLGDTDKLKEYQKLLRTNLACVDTILDPTAIPMGKDWSWAGLPFSTDELVKFLITK